MDVVEEVLCTIVEALSLFFEYIGVAVMCFTGVRGLVELIQRKSCLRLHLGEGMATGLQFFMGGEILTTVVTKDLKSAAMVGALVLLRTALAFVVHWETSQEEHKANAERDTDEERETVHK